MTVSDLTERDLIARVQQRLPPAPSWMVVGIGDDAAVVEPERNQLEVLTVDAIVEGVHFSRAFCPPPAIGHRALAVNLSDLAAMGAQPRLVLLSFVLPSSLPCDEFDGILDGIAALAAVHRVHVAGGNLTRSPGPLMIDVTAIGNAKRRQVLTRGGARGGDEIYVTGTIGGAAAGLQYLREGSPLAAGDMTSSVQRYLYPEPRVRAGMLIGRNRAASSCMDLSDGMADGIRQITEMSGVGATVDASLLPLEPSARRWFDARGVSAVTEAMSGGDDYELLLTVPPRRKRKLFGALQGSGVGLTRVGVCTAERALQLSFGTSTAAAVADFPKGFTHFR